MIRAAVMPPDAVTAHPHRHDEWMRPVCHRIDIIARLHRPVPALLAQAAREGELARAARESSSRSSIRYPSRSHSPSITSSFAALAGSYSARWSVYT
jgi:hypothetical protein